MQKQSILRSTTFADETIYFPEEAQYRPLEEIAIIVEWKKVSQNKNFEGRKVDKHNMVS